ncbi:hypothetical protein ZIOFF_032239 [Zingiber officinale]|uniref:DNA 5'-3' helicase n=1 Tax=Zingiber officinale TaxID=94328 RepID=A0A8J5GI21_ZINOF|nr:hypothetical protein ZIOFF_032239 [Zingiber officinale]
MHGATRNLNRMAQVIDRFKATDATKLRAEYNRLVGGLAQRGNLAITDAWLGSPALPDDILKEAVPGNTRRTEHFLSVLRRLLGCHDASIAIKPVFDRFQSVIITSGSLTPIDLYSRLLNFNPVISRCFTCVFDKGLHMPNGSNSRKVSLEYCNILLCSADVSASVDLQKEMHISVGKVVEGIDFDRHYGRLGIMFGFPFQDTPS